MPIPTEEHESRSSGKLSIEDVDYRFAKKLSLDNPYRLRRKAEGMKHGEDLPVFSPCVRNENLDANLSMNKASCSQRKAKGMKREEDLPVFSPRSGGKLPLGKVPASRKKPNATKPMGDPKDLQSRYADRLKKRKMDVPFMGVTIWTGGQLSEDDDIDDIVVTASWARAQVAHHIPSSLVLTEAMERKEDPDDIFFREFKGIEMIAHKYATAALSYLQKKGHNLELVKAGFYEEGEINSGYIVHFNFKAKRACDPRAPVETYFCQLCDYGEGDSSIIVECCVSLGKSDSLPYVRDNRGCKYCTKYVHHPAGGCKGIIWGRETWKKDRLVIS